MKNTTKAALIAISAKTTATIAITPDILSEVLQSQYTIIFLKGPGFLWWQKNKPPSLLEGGTKNS